LARLGTLRLRHTGPVAAVVLAADGKTIITASGEGRGTHGTGIHFWDVRTGKETAVVEPEAPVDSLALSADGKLLAAACGDRLRCWELSAGNRMRSIEALRHGSGSHTQAVAISEDGKTVASAGIGTSVRIYDVKTGRLLRTLGESRNWWRVAYSPDGKLVAAGDGSETHVWDLGTGKEVWQVEHGAEWLPGLAFSPDGKRVATRDQEGKGVRLLDATTGKEVRHYEGHKQAVKALAFSPDGKWLASGSDDATVRLSDMATGRSVHVLRGHADTVMCLAFSRDGRLLASGGEDRSVQLWDPATGRVHLHLDGHVGEIDAVAFSPDGRTIVSGGVDAVRLWDAASSRMLWSHAAPAQAVGFAPGGKILHAASDAGEVRRYQTTSGAELTSVYVYTDQAGSRATAFSHNGDVVATSPRSYDEKHTPNEINLWRTATGSGVWERQGEVADSFAFSPDDRLLAVGGLGSLVCLLNARTGEKGRQIGADKASATCVAFSPDGHTLATAGYGQTVWLWKVASGQEFHRLTGPREYTRTVAFSPDGRLVASGGNDRTVRLWEVASGQEVAQFVGHTDAVTCVAFTPDGRTLVSGSRDETLLVWDGTGLLRQGHLPALTPSVAALADLWSELAASAARAEPALWKLVASGPRAVAWCKDHLRPAQPVPAGELARLLRDLDAERFAVREQAEHRLQELGDRVEAGLRAALARTPPLEVRRRVEQLLGRLEPGAPRQLHQSRAVAVLESIGTPDARDVLRHWASGVPEARLTRDAKAALDRLKKRAATANP
jgi:WD40 repeat protein